MPFFRDIPDHIVGYRICKSLSSQVRDRLYSIFGEECMIYIDSIMDSYEKSHDSEYTNDLEVIDHVVQDILSHMACWSMHYIDAYDKDCDELEIEDCPEQGV